MTTSRFLRVTRRIYGPGPTRSSRVLLAVPGRDYPADYVRQVADPSLVEEPPAVEVLTPSEVSVTLDRSATEPSPKLVAVVDETGDGDPTPEELSLDKLPKKELLEVAAQRGVDLSELGAKPTNLQIIGAIRAAAVDGDAGAEGAPADEGES